MHDAKWFAVSACPRMLPVSDLILFASESVVFKFVLIWATPSLMERAVPRIVAAEELIPLAVPLMVPAVPLIDVARPSIEWARLITWSSWPWSGLAVSRIDDANWLVRPSLRTAAVAVLMPPAVFDMLPA